MYWYEMECVYRMYLITNSTSHFCIGQQIFSHSHLIAHTILSSNKFPVSKDFRLRSITPGETKWIQVIKIMYFHLLGSCSAERGDLPIR